MQSSRKGPETQLPPISIYRPEEINIIDVSHVQAILKSSILLKWQFPPKPQQLEF